MKKNKETSGYTKEIGRFVLVVCVLISFSVLVAITLMWEHGLTAIVASGMVLICLACAMELVKDDP